MAKCGPLFDYIHIKSRAIHADQNDLANPVPYMYENVLDDLERRNVLVEGTPFPDFELSALPFTAHEICYSHPLIGSTVNILVKNAYLCPSREILEKLIFALFSRCFSAGVYNFLLQPLSSCPKILRKCRLNMICNATAQEYINTHTETYKDKDTDENKHRNYPWKQFINSSGIYTTRRWSSPCSSSSLSLSW